MHVGGPGPGVTRLVVDRCKNPSKRVGTSLHCLDRQCDVPLNRLGTVLASVKARRLTRLRVMSTVICRLAHGLSRGRVVSDNFSACCISRAANICPMTTDNAPRASLYVRSGKSILASLRRSLTTRNAVTGRRPIFQAPRGTLFCTNFKAFNILSRGYRLQPRGGGGLRGCNEADYFRRGLRGRQRKF